MLILYYLKHKSMKILFILSFALTISFSSFAIIKPQVTDTLYYLVDTTKVPVKDRMMKIGVEANFKFYNILCQCSKDLLMPTFIYSLNKPELTETLSKSKAEELKFISLAELLQMSQQESFDIFNNHHTVFFIEPDGNKYLKHKVTFLHPVKRNQSIDTETVH